MLPAREAGGHDSGPRPSCRVVVGGAGSASDYFGLQHTEAPDLTGARAASTAVQSLLASD